MKEHFQKAMGTISYSGGILLVPLSFPPSPHVLTKHRQLYITPGGQLGWAQYRPTAPCPVYLSHMGRLKGEIVPQLSRSRNVLAGGEYFLEPEREKSNYIHTLQYWWTTYLVYRLEKTRPVLPWAAQAWLAAGAL